MSAYGQKRTLVSVQLTFESSCAVYCVGLGDLLGSNGVSGVVIIEIMNAGFRMGESFKI